MLGTQNRLAWPVVSSDLWRDMQTLTGNGGANGHALWKPAAMVVESDEAFVLRLEGPGITADSLDLPVRERQECGPARWKLVERRHRSVGLDRTAEGLEVRRQRLRE